MEICGSVVAKLVLFWTEFKEATVAYNLESRTISLDDVFFPSTVICNMNTLRRSFMDAIMDDEEMKVT